MNKYRLILPTTSEQSLNIPIEIKFDLLDRNDSLVDYEKKTITEILNQEKDFEVIRFSHSPNFLTDKTEINYEFYFAPSGATSANTTWINSYITQGFSSQEVYYFRNNFVKSFFKLDFYDSVSQSDQTNYITTIIPVQQGVSVLTPVGYRQENIKSPKFKLDFLGDKEGFFLYWLKKRTFLNINTFYMTAKFFDAKSGVFIKMMNRPQSLLTGLNKFNFQPENYFYYKVVLNYDDLTYKVYDIQTNLEVGDSTQPIKWYEYINP